MVLKTPSYLLSSLPKDEQHSVNNVALAASIRADNGGKALKKRETVLFFCSCSARKSKGSVLSAYLVKRSNPLYTGI